MAWVTPRTWVTGELVTAAHLNQDIRDNIGFLAGSQGARVETAQGTASTSYVDLTTPGPAVTVTTGTKAFVHLSAEIDALGIFAYMSFAVSGVSTVAADDARSLEFAHHSSGGFVVRLGTSIYLSGLTAGSNTFTAKYRASGGTPTWGHRNIIVTPLP